MHDVPPLIITLALETKWQDYFTQLRKQYFPAHFNYLDAHLTLFHCLPSQEASIPETLNALAKRGSMLLEVAGLKNMGNGVAFDLKCPELKEMHKALQAKFQPWLAGQDRQPLWPHITIQNKVTAFKAAQTLKELEQGFEPVQIKGTGFSTWHYLKGPWQHVADYPFLR